MVDDTHDSSSVTSPTVRVRNVPSEMDSLRQQMAEMTEQVTSINEDVILEIHICQTSGDTPNTYSHRQQLDPLTLQHPSQIPVSLKTRQ